MAERKESIPLHVPTPEIDVLAYVVEHGGAAKLSSFELEEIGYVRPDPNQEGYIVPKILLEKNSKRVSQTLTRPNSEESSLSYATDVSWHGPYGVGRGAIPGSRAGAHFNRM